MASTETPESESEATESEDKAPELQFDVQVQEKSTCERHVVVTITAAEVLRYRQQTFDDVAPKAELPGFRAGKAPRKLVESKFKDQVDDQVKSTLVMESLQQVTEGDHFSAISEPDLDYDALEIPAEGDFIYEFDIEVRPDFDTPDWKGLKLELPSVELSDGMIDQHLSRTLRRFMPGEAVDGAAEIGDTLILNGKFTLDGEVIGEFEEQEVLLHQELVLRDARIDNFGELAVGKKEGDKITTTVEVSASAANEELAEKKVEVEFEIHEIRRIEVSEIGSAKLEELGFDDTEELRSFVRDELARQFDYRQQQALRDQIVEQLTAGADWELPKALVRKQTSRELQRRALEMQRSGYSNEEVNSMVNAARINAEETTVASLREHFVLEKIAEDEEIEPLPEDYDREVELIAEQSDMSPRRIRARLEKTGQMDAIRNQIIEREVISRIKEAGKITEKPDEEFLKEDTKTAALGVAIAGEFEDIPEAKHADGTAVVPGQPKLPELKDEDKGE